MPIYKGSTNQGLIYYGSPNTNCLTSVPKNVNLTYNAGVFTVHAGSIITVPYGGGTVLNVGDVIGSYYEVVKVVNSYIQLKLLKDFSDTFGGDTSILYMLTLGFNTKGFMYWSGTVVSRNTSGSTDNNASNSDGCLYFDTTNNIIYRRYSGGTTGYQYGGGINSVWISLPIACNYGTPTKAEQIFDWCGFIGSTAFVLPGVKGLKSNGIKADGTYNNIEVETKSVLLNNYDYQTTNQQFGLSENGNFIWRTDKYYSQPTAPTLTAYSIWHNITDNFNYYTGLDTSTGWVKTTGYDFNVVNSISTDSSFKITSLIPVTVQPLRTVRPIDKVFKGATLVFGKEVFRQVFTSSGNITFPGTIMSLKVIVVGGGAGGSAGNYDNDWINSTGSGAAGGYAEKIYSKDELSSLKGANVSFTVGGGGAAGAYKSGVGGVGGKTSFMSITATGGNPSSGYSNWGAPGAIGQGGVGSGGDVNKQGNPGQLGRVNSPGWAPAGGVGWNINGVVYGSGGNGGAAFDNGIKGASGCVYIEYTY